ncbi:MAG TPA: ATP-binding protein [Thermoanaerobaculia bacterium]|nr:ATP-binding protein [Thermoanaerobaculia bacterium]
MRYRAAAWKQFEVDLENNLGALQTALGEEIREAAGPNAVAAPLQKAANETIGAFRLNGLYAEIRSGETAQVVLARVPGAGVEEGGRLLDDAAWQRLAASPGVEAFSLSGGRRAAGRAFRAEGLGDRVSLVVADRTVLVEETLSSIRTSLIEFGAAGLFLALAGGYWLATRVLRPIGILTTQAGAMAATPSTPGARLAIPNPDDELGRLGLTFNLLLERIEESVRQTRAFIADAAHELKTPVAIVRTEAELSLSGDRSLAESREALAAIAAESANLSRLVSDLTLLAEAETLEQPLERRLVDLTELLHDVVRSLRSLAASRGVTVDLEAAGGHDYRGDERLLRRILTNLLENAIKFSREGGRIAVVLSEDSESLELRVLDESPTLSAEERQRVFQRFYRSATARGSGAIGSGLGLAIVQWAMTLHGGRIRVEPREGIGNVFVAEFPSPREW